MGMPLFPDSSGPLVFAHRGYSAAKPENTLSAFEAARACGSHGVELDIQMCGTGELVVFHDWTVERLTGSAGTVIEMSWRELSQLTIGDGERIPRLTEVFDLLGKDIFYDIEIKNRGHRDSGIEQALASLIDTRGLAGKVLVSSFNPYPLKEMRNIAPHIRTAIIYTKHSAEMPWYLKHGLGKTLAGTMSVKPDRRQVSRLGMLPRRLTGVPVLPWTVDDPGEARRLIELGCAGVITNTPETILPALR